MLPRDEAWVRAQKMPRGLTLGPGGNASSRSVTRAAAPDGSYSSRQNAKFGQSNASFDAVQWSSCAFVNVTPSLLGEGGGGPGGAICYELPTRFREKRDIGTASLNLATLGKPRNWLEDALLDARGSSYARGGGSKMVSATTTALNMALTVAISFGPLAAASGSVGAATFVAAEATPSVFLARLGLRRGPPPWATRAAVRSGSRGLIGRWGCLEPSPAAIRLESKS